MRCKRESEGRTVGLVLLGALALGVAWMLISIVPDVTRYVTIRRM